jgi:threonine dehydrogenase-like Zn-dependent dehydrogenase
MKVAVCYEFGKRLVIEDIDFDPPQAGEIQVDLKACAICHSDIHYMEGQWGGYRKSGRGRCNPGDTGGPCRRFPDPFLREMLLLRPGCPVSV